MDFLVDGPSVDNGVSTLPFGNLQNDRRLVGRLDVQQRARRVSGRGATTNQSTAPTNRGRPYRFGVARPRRYRGRRETRGPRIAWAGDLRFFLG